ncbi:hypothetical protein J6590_021179 [Homalodisca vitripennis]|nr:hypothetical protein J6590_021179 [Homalodisca vitripennis]
MLIQHKTSVALDFRRTVLGAPTNRMMRMMIQYQATSGVKTAVLRALTKRVLIQHQAISTTCADTAPSVLYYKAKITVLRACRNEYRCCTKRVVLQGEDNTVLQSRDKLFASSDLQKVLSAYRTVLRSPAQQILIEHQTSGVAQLREYSAANSDCTSADAAPNERCYRAKYTILRAPAEQMLMQYQTSGAAAQSGRALTTTQCPLFTCPFFMALWIKPCRPLLCLNTLFACRALVCLSELYVSKRSLMSLLLTTSPLLPHLFLRKSTIA